MAPHPLGTTGNKDRFTSIYLLFYGYGICHLMAAQLENLEDALQGCVNSLKIWKELIDAYLEGDEKTEELSHLEEIVKECCVIDYDTRKNAGALQETLDHFNNTNNDEETDVDGFYREKLDQRVDTFSGNYQQEKVWKEVFHGVTDRDIEEVEQAATETATEYEEMNDSIFYSNVFTPPVDPISKMVIQNPYKNRVCGHVYEYKFILQYVKSMKNKAKCPYIGCNNRNITVGQLVKDDETRAKIETYQHTNGTQSD